MSLFDAINTAAQAMSVHRFRSEVAAENLSNIYGTPGYRRKVVDLTSTSFTNAMNDAKSDGPVTGPSSATRDAMDGGAQIAGVQVAGVHREGPMSERQQAFLSTVDMMRAKSAYELNARAATMLKSMALSSLEIGRGG